MEYPTIRVVDPAEAPRASSTQLMAFTNGAAHATADFRGGSLWLPPGVAPDGTDAPRSAVNAVPISSGECSLRGRRTFRRATASAMRAACTNRPSCVVGLEALMLGHERDRMSCRTCGHESPSGLRPPDPALEWVS